MMKLSNKTYDVLKWLVVIVIPAVTTFYCVLDRTFGWGYASVVTTIQPALCTCIGAIVGISTATYNKDEMLRIKEDNKW